MLEVKNISKTYGDKVAVNNVSFHVEAGDVFGIIGHNGAGKSSLIKMITGVLEPDNNSGTNRIAPNGASSVVPLLAKKI